MGQDDPRRSFASARLQTSSATFSGAVLAGGASHRFGSDKSQHVYEGRTLLEHALAALEDAGDLMVAGADPPSGSRARSVADIYPEHGPISGMHAALVHCETAWVAIAACDMPRLPRLLWPFLMARSEQALLVIPEGPRGPEPLAALYHRDLADKLEARIRGGTYSIQTLIHDVPSRVVPWSDIRLEFGDDIFLNANRREDLK